MATVAGKTAPHRGRVRELLADPEWAGQPVWMLNLLRFKGGHGSAGEASYQRYLEAQGSQELQRRLVMKGHARTVIGETEYHQMTIVEYPSPEAWIDMGRTDEYAARNAELRLAGLEEQYLIPLKPGFLRLESRPAPAPARPFAQFDAETVWSTPNGLVGDAAEGSSPATSSTREQAAAFVADATIGAESPVVVPGTTSPTTVWHLNLLRFSDRDTATPGATYLNYGGSGAMGGKDGLLARYGARVAMSTPCFPSMIGDVDFDSAAIAEYPSRESYLTMGTDPEYIELSRFRHAGLESTYIISCVPDFLEEHAAAPAGGGGGGGGGGSAPKL
jgi:uncharacterized protein (DUF1330 family)